MTLRLLDPKVPASLQPLIRAYLFGYASATVPRILTLFLAHLTKKRKEKAEDEEQLWASLQDSLCQGLHWQRFPTFCATLVGGSTLLQARDYCPLWCHQK